MTGDKKYQEWGWNIFQGIEKYTKVKHGYTTIGNVRNPLDLRPKDMMESFFLGETLKYLYLLFADKQVCSLEHHQTLANRPAHFWTCQKTKFKTGVQRVIGNKFYGHQEYLTTTASKLAILALAA